MTDNTLTPEMIAAARLAFSSRSIEIDGNIYALAVGGVVDMTYRDGKLFLVLPERIAKAARKDKAP